MRTRAIELPFRSGQAVRQKCDPRHIGDVRAVFNTLSIKIVWRGTGWISQMPARDLERAPAEDC